MAENNDSGSPTAGENGESNGFVHVDGGEVSVFVEPVDSAQMGGSINQDHAEQDDGVVVTCGDTIQDDPNDVKVTEDGGKEEFVDCPDELISYDGRNAVMENREAVEIPDSEQTFGDSMVGTRFSSVSDSGIHEHDLTGELESLRAVLEKTIGERESFVREYQEERRSFVEELANLRHQLKALNKSDELADDHLISQTGEGEEKSILPLHEMISECSKFIEHAVNEQSQTEGTIRELHAAIDMKDKEIEDLNARVNEQSFEMSSKEDIEATADRIVASFSLALGDEELLDKSVSGKMAYVEKNTSLLIEKYNHFLSEIELLSQSLTDVRPDLSMTQAGTETIFLTVREELLELKRREVELARKTRHLEDENGKLMEHLDKDREMIEMAKAETGKLRVDLEREKTRYGNTKEKLSMAVTKGKALVQQRDSLKQSLADKTSELEKCLLELQTKTSALEAIESSIEELVQECDSLKQSLADKTSELEKCLLELQTKSTTLEASESRIEELIRSETLADSLQEALRQKDMILEKCGEILSLNDATEELQSLDILERVTWLANERNKLAHLSVGFHKVTEALSSIDLPEAMQSSNLESQVTWLLESYHLAKDESIKLQDDINRTGEAARNEIDRLTASLLAEMQEKNYLQQEFEDLTRRYEGIVEKEHEISLEKEQMVSMLLDAAGIVIDGQEDAYKLHSDMAIVIERCFAKIKEQASASLESSHVEVEMFERIQNLLYVRDQESKLYEQILEEVQMDGLELRNRSNELLVVSEELHALKDEKGSLQTDLQRSEEKAALLREKLSMAVKKGKGLVQERENMKQLMGEKNALIEKLKLDLQQQESAFSDCRDQINKLSAEEERIPKLEADLVGMKEQRDQIEKFLVESNSMLQRVIEAIDGITLPVDFEEPVEKVKWIAEYLSECQVAKTQAEQELGYVKDALSVSEKTISQLNEEKRELETAKTYVEEELQKAMEESQVVKTQVEQELESVKDEVSMLARKLTEALTTMKSLEDALSVSEKNISQLTEEKREIEIAKTYVEEELHKVMEEATSQTSKFQEVCASRNSLEEALSLAENNMSALMKEKNDAQASKVAAEMELQKVEEEVCVHTSKLDEAYKTIQSLEGAMSQLQANVSLFAEENDKAQDSRAVLENEIKKLKEEAESQVRKVVDASSTIKALEDALSKAENTISDLVGEKKNAEQEISALNSQLSAYMQELAGKHDSRAFKLSGYFDSLQVLLKDRTLSTLLKQSFEKKFETLKDMDRLLKEMRDNIVDGDLELLQNYPVTEETFHLSTFLPAGFDNVVNIEMANDELNATDGEGIASYVGKTVENFHLRNKILADDFRSFSTLIDELIASLLTKLETTRNTVSIMLGHMKALQQNVNTMEMDKQTQENRVVVLEHDIKTLLSACADATQELKFKVENNLLEMDSAIDLEKSNHGLSPDVNAAEELLSAVRNVGSLIEHFSNVKNTMSTTIGDLQRELEKTRSIYEKANEEKDIFQTRVSELETELEASQNVCSEMSFKLEDYQAKEDKWNEREEKLTSSQTTTLNKDHEAENALLPASEIKSLFDKTNGITIPFPNLEVGDTEPQESVPVEKLFYIVDNVSELLHQMTLLSHAREELQSTLSKQSLEVENLKEEVEEHIRDKQDSEKMKKEMFELSLGLENIIQKLGGDESVGGKKSAGVVGVGLLPVLERLVLNMVLDSEHSKSKAQDLGAKLLETQKVAEELASKVKLFEDFNQSRTSSPDTIQDRGVFEAPSLPARSEISEIEDAGPLGKIATPVPTAAHTRTLRKGSTDQLVINIDSESDRLIKNKEADDDKGHMFKSLHTSGLVPIQGKMIADRVDGIWVSGSRALMNRPRARLGIIAYWLVLHLWLLGTIL